MLVPAIIAVAVIVGGGMVYYMLTPDSPVEANTRAMPNRGDTQKGGAEKAVPGNAGAKAPASN